MNFPISALTRSIKYQNQPIMKTIRIGIFSLLALITIIGCYKEKTTALDELLLDVLESVSADGSLDYFKLPHFSDLSSLPQDPKNPLTEAKVQLGRMLFHETGIASNSHAEDFMMTYSCASCHSPGEGFSSPIAQSIGDGGTGMGLHRNLDERTSTEQADISQIRTPSLINSAFQTNMNWNGEFGATGSNYGTEYKWKNGTKHFINQKGFEGLESQAIMALEMHRMNVNDQLMQEYGYKEHFDEAFPEVYKPLRYSPEQAGKAIAAYERTLTAYNAPFQKWLRGEYDEMLEVEKKGAILFFGKAGCVSCHTGPALNSMEYHALGMKDLAQCDEDILVKNPDHEVNLGRGGFTGNEEDNFKFKVPQLYNLRDMTHFGHGASFKSIEDVVDYKNEGVSENANVPQDQVSHQFLKIGLTDEEKANLAYFIKYALYDETVKDRKANYILSDFCFPNNDQESKDLLGCE